MKNKKKILALVIILIFLLGFNFGRIMFAINNNVDQFSASADDISLDDQEATIRAIQKALPSVVSIAVHEPTNEIIFNLSTGEQTSNPGTKKIGSGSGFIVSSDGLIITNRHVVEATDRSTGQYKVVLNNGKEYQAQVVGTDILHDVAMLRIRETNLPYLEMGDSSNLPIGLTVLAIGNSLGKYQNSVTKGIISGLGRSLIAGNGAGYTEALDNVIQTDAEINIGNSGGPLIDLHGRVVGVNVAVDLSGQSIGFAIPINSVKPVIDSVKDTGRIIRPRLGVRYVMIDQAVKTKYELKRDQGALIIKGMNGEYAVALGSPAMKAGIWEGDIIIQVDEQVVNKDNQLQDITQHYKPGDTITLKIDRKGQILEKKLTLDEFKFL
ncbi:MAG: trypsin-like peptidase domain-containing protein [bacterium]